LTLFYRRKNGILCAKVRSKKFVAGKTLINFLLKLIRNAKKPPHFVIKKYGGKSRKKVGKVQHTGFLKLI